MATSLNPGIADSAYTMFPGLVSEDTRSSLHHGDDETRSPILLSPNATARPSSNLLTCPLSKNLNVVIIPGPLDVIFGRGRPFNVVRNLRANFQLQLFGLIILLIAIRPEICVRMNRRKRSCLTHHFRSSFSSPACWKRSDAENSKRIQDTIQPSTQERREDRYNI